MTNTTDRLGTEKIGKLLISLSVPSIIAQIVNILYNMVDRIYIGRMANGAVAMSALSIALPIITMILAVTQLFGMGGAPLAAIKLGQNDKDAAEKTMTNSFSVLLISSVIITVVVLFFARPLLMLFGADDSNIDMGVEYISIYCVGTLFVQISFGMNMYINTQGFTKIGMATVVIGAVLNIILDPLFIFVFGLGVKGAAIATIISQCVSAIWVMKFLLGKKSTIKLRKKYLIPNWKVLGPIMALGVSPFIMGSTESLLQISFNNQLSLYGGTMAVGTMSILISLNQMICMPLQGLCMGAQPILSFNFGAQKLDRVRKTFKLLFVSCLCVSVLGFGCIALFSRFFASVFTQDSQTLEFAQWAIRVYIIGAMLFGAQIACQQSFVSLGQAKHSLLMALFRKVILLIPMIYILPMLIGHSDLAVSMAAPIMNITKDGGMVFAVLVSESISDILAATVTSTLFFSFYRKHLRDNNTKERSE